MPDEGGALLASVELFQPGGAARDLLTQVNESVSEINSKRPLPPAVLERLQTEILYDRVHSSAVTEGNRLSKRETIIVLSAGVVEAGSRRDVIEVKNLANAISELEAALAKEIPFNEALFRHLQKLVLTDLDPTAGAFRQEDVAISGAKVQPPNFYDVPDLIHSTLSSPALQREDIHAVQKAAWAHWAVTRVHPFRDGNGRVARLFQDYVLLKFGCVPAPLQPEDREGGYYSALESADLGDGLPLLELVAKNTLRMADRYLSIMRDEVARHDWVAKITLAATEKIQQTVHRRFLATQRSANILKAEFSNIARAIVIPGLEIKFRDYGGVDFEKYQELDLRHSAKRTWLFGLDFRIEETLLRYIFFFGIHYHSAWDPASTLPTNVVLLVSGGQGDYFQLLDDLEEDRVSLREIVPAGNRFWRRRFNPIQRRSEWDQDITGGTIARDFVEEVLRRLSLI